MNLLSIEGVGGQVCVTFGHEAGDVVKLWRATGAPDLGDRLSVHLLRHEHQYRFIKAVREAERDIAYRVFGDKWREHVGRYWGRPSESERALASKAREMRPDLFG